MGKIKFKEPGEYLTIPEFKESYQGRLVTLAVDC